MEVHSQPSSRVPRVLYAVPDEAKYGAAAGRRRNASTMRTYRKRCFRSRTAMRLQPQASMKQAGSLAVTTRV